MRIKLKTSFVNGNMRIPFYVHYGDAGMDLQANIEGSLTIGPGATVAVPTGLFVELPESKVVEKLFDDYEEYVWTAEIRSRSGLASKGLVVANSPGTIDYGYRGEIKVLLTNNSNDGFIIDPGMRIAQIVLVKAHIINWVITHELSDTSRSTGGFGSTGL